MKRIAAVLALWFPTCLSLFAQHESDWIRFDQPYVRIPVAEDGLYRLTAADLSAAGFPIQSADARHLQLFHRGVEQAIVVTGEDDGVLNDADYLEFYGRRNDGTSDTQLYIQPGFQPHTFHNLFSDTTSYFLTVGASNGKRASYFQQGSGGLAAEVFHTAEELLLLTSEYSGGKDYSLVASSQLHLSAFDQGEGWMSPMILYNQPAATFVVPAIKNLFPSGGNPTLEVLLTGRGGKDHPVEIFVGEGSRLLTSISVSGYESVKVSQQIEFSDFNSSDKLTVRVKVNGTDGPRVSVNYIKITYPQLFEMGNEETHVFNLQAQPINKSLIEINNAPLGVELFDITDPNNIRQIGATAGAKLTAVVNNTATPRKMLAAVAKTPLVKRVNFRAIDPRQHNYIIISHPVLRSPTSGYNDPVEAYASYRASLAGGSYDTLVVNVDLLYDQFNYGEQSPLAIHRFMKFLADKKLPAYLFIIGEGLDVYYDYFRKPDQYSNYKNLVPTAGYPGSDMAFTAGLAGSTYGPSVATGRITASTPADVAAYLNKVVETEARPYNDLRRKNVLHLSGGIIAGEPQQFRAFLEEFKPTAENVYLGGKVSAIAKQSTDLELINIADEVNKGVNLVTFFGHSSVSTLDFDIGFVTDPVLGYNNKGKYPVLLMNGCDAGAFFVNGKLFGEDWINAPNKGAIGFIAHASLGYINQLRKYSGTFYSVAYGDSVYIRKGLGDVQKETAVRYLQGSSLPLDISQVQQMILLGDPAVRLFGAGLPDYEIRDESVSIVSLTEEPVTALSDSFAIRFIVRNYGVALDKPFQVRVERTLNDRSVVTYDSSYAPVLYGDTLQFIIRGRDLNGAGNNTFAIKADGFDLIEEIEEGNNTGYIDYFIPLNGTQNIFPEKFAIVSSRDISLSFQHTDILSGDRIFEVEIDTASTFHSPYKTSFETEATVLGWQPITLLETDTLVYYWRTRLKDPLENESKDWSTSSFTYINNGPDGWAQVAFPQFSENTYEGLVQDAVLLKTNFQETKTSISIKTFGALAGKPADSVSFKVGNAEYNLYQQGFGCRSNTINLVAFDRRSTVPYIGVPLQWFNRAGRTCGREPWIINSFTPTELITGHGDDLIAYVDNVNMGDSVILFSIGDAGYASWPSQALDKLEEVGISTQQILDLLPGEATIILARKGSTPGTAQIIKVSDSSPEDERLALSTTITGRYTSGKITSVQIGPAREWQSLLLRAGEKEEQDIVSVDIIGITPSGNEVLLYPAIAAPFDLSGISTEEYPRLRLAFETHDDLNLTAAQLDHWLVTFEPVAEGLIFYEGNDEPQSLPEGEVWTGTYGFVNAAHRNFNSALTVNFRVFNHELQNTEQGSFEIEAPAPGDTTHFFLMVNTVGKRGVNDIEVFVNPKIIPELHYENNVFTLFNHLEVTREEKNPVLDVSIDGRYIEMGEFVSPSPQIRIKVWDENPYLKIMDTTGISVFLAYPCDVEPCPNQRINFSRPDVKWYPANDTSEFLIDFTPDHLENGTYNLRIQADDASGNPSGSVPYVITFIVKNETTVVASLPYPNPANDTMSFDIVLSGDPSQATIDLRLIHTNGNFVGAWNQHDFQPLHVGNNVIRWDLKKGDIPLPGGIYIYRLLITSPEGIAEQIGKIVVIR